MLGKTFYDLPVTIPSPSECCPCLSVSALCFVSFLNVTAVPVAGQRVQGGNSRITGACSHLFQIPNTPGPDHLNTI